MTLEYISLAAAAQNLPAEIKPETLWRWVTKGVVRPDGDRVRLEAQRVGRRYFTTTAAVEHFMQTAFPVLVHHEPPVKRVRQRKRRRSSAQLERDRNSARAQLRA